MNTKKIQSDSKTKASKNVLIEYDKKIINIINKLERIENNYDYLEDKIENNLYNLKESLNNNYHQCYENIETINQDLNNIKTELNQKIIELQKENDDRRIISIILLVIIGICIVILFSNIDNVSNSIQSVKDSIANKVSYGTIEQLENRINTISDDVNSIWRDMYL